MRSGRHFSNCLLQPCRATQPSETGCGHIDNRKYWEENLERVLLSMPTHGRRLSVINLEEVLLPQIAGSTEVSYYPFCRLRDPMKKTTPYLSHTTTLIAVTVYNRDRGALFCAHLLEASPRLLKVISLR